jgi:hypothetical protein
MPAGQWAYRTARTAGPPAPRGGRRGAQTRRARYRGLSAIRRSGGFRGKGTFRKKVSPSGCLRCLTSPIVGHASPRETRRSSSAPRGQATCPFSLSLMTTRDQRHGGAELVYALSQCAPSSTRSATSSVSSPVNTMGRMPSAFPGALRPRSDRRHPSPLDGHSARKIPAPVRSLSRPFAGRRAHEVAPRVASLVRASREFVRR